MLDPIGSHDVAFAGSLRFSLAFTVKIAAVSLAVSYLAVSRRQTERLRQSLNRHKDAVANAAPFLNDLRRRNLDALNVSLRPNLNLLLAEAHAASTNRAAAAEFSDLPERIQSFGRTEVRELSHRIAVGEAEIAQQQRPELQEEQPEDWREATAEMLTAAPPNPIVGGLLLVALTFAWLSYPTFARFSIGVGLAVCMTLTLAIGGLAFNVINPRTPIGRFVGIFIIFAATLLMNGLMAREALRALPPEILDLESSASGTLSLPVLQVLTSTAFAVALALTGANSRRNRISAQLSQADALWTNQMDSMRRESNAVNQRLAQLLHGTVQSRLALTSIRLAELNEPGGSPELVKARREEVFALLESIENELDQWGEIDFAATHQPLDAVLAAIRADWLGILDCEWQISPEAGQQLTVRPQLTHQVGELAREAVSNARRHGQASRVSIEITLKRTKPVTLEIRVTDNGVGPSSSVTPGLGQTTLGSIGARWVLLRKDEDSTVLLVILTSYEEPVPALREPSVEFHGLTNSASSLVEVGAGKSS
jgi:signal transduction histidine kinase